MPGKHSENERTQLFLEPKKPSSGQTINKSVEGERCKLKLIIIIQSINQSINQYYCTLQSPELCFTSSESNESSCFIAPLHLPWSKICPAWNEECLPNWGGTVPPHQVTMVTRSKAGMNHRSDSDCELLKPLLSLVAIFRRLYHGFIMVLSWFYL